MTVQTAIPLPATALAAEASAVENPLVAPAAAGSGTALVPLRGRHDGWTPERQRAFLEKLADCGSVRGAAAAVGMNEKSAYRLRRRPGAAAFAAAWNDALACATDLLAANALERAIHGTVHPVYHRGELVGEERRYSDRLTTFLLANRAGLFGKAQSGAQWSRRLVTVAAGGFSVWHDAYHDQWRTNFPAPADFDGWEGGRPFEDGYERELSPDEEKAMDVREAVAPGSGCDPKEAEAARQRFFAAPADDTLAAGAFWDEDADGDAADGKGTAEGQAG